ncbi:hypothetical protein ACGFNU_25310 [Spirillospora sp. NPDC048911]|uniref:hypothetical protein n=1 Tax=Spirillospora sp. NPDC048911 TaxID=3364527 RepID=UPI003717F11E
MTPKHADPQRIQAHANDLQADVIPKIKAAGDKLNGDGVYNLEGGDFSIACVMAGSAYPIALQFAFEDIKMLMRTVQGFSEKVDQAGVTYLKSEQNSTI